MAFRFDTKTRHQLAIFLLLISGLYMLNFVKTFIDGFSIVSGLTVGMIIGALDLYIAYLIYSGKF